MKYEDVSGLRLGLDDVYSGFAVAGSSADQKFSVPSLRLVLKNGETVLLDRGSTRRLEPLAKRLSEYMGKPMHKLEELHR